MTREEFCELPVLINEVKQRREEIEVLEGIAEGGSQASDNDRVQSSARDRTEILAAIIDLKQELEPLEEYLEQAKAEARDLMHKNLKGRDLRLMRLRYLTGLKWYQVAKALRYSVNYVQEISARCLERLFPQ